MAVHGRELEKGVERHELDARLFIHFLFGYLLKIVLHCPFGMRVTVAVRITEHTAILTHHHHIHPPSVNADGFDVDAFVSHLLQTLDDFMVQRQDIPIEMSPCLNDGVGKTGQFSLFQLPLHNGAQNGASAGGTQIDCQEIHAHKFWFCSL